MYNSLIKKRILLEMNNLVEASCSNKSASMDYKPFYEAIIQNHYHATSVEIDYHRRRITLDILLNDANYDPTKVNMHMNTIHANFWYRNLKEFLKSCVNTDTKSLAFYAGLIRNYKALKLVELSA